MRTRLHPAAGLRLAVAAALAVGVSSCSAPAAPPGPTSSTSGSATSSAALSPDPSVPAGTTTAAGQGPTSSAAAQPTSPRVEVVASGLQAPWSVAFAGATPIVSLRDAGTILEVLPDGSARTIGTVDGVVHGGEGGLLGLLPNESATQLYVYSTARGGNRLQRFELTGKPGSLALGEATTLLESLPAGATHNGGRLAWGPDGLLYVTVGDAGTRDAAQDPGRLAGKILRLTADGEPAPGNPFPGSPVYSLGHRNQQGLAWDARGRMFAAEFGQDTWDEVNRIEPGKNYGWPVVEGRAGEADYEDPVWQAPPGEASPSGMAFAGGRLLLAGLRGEALLGVDPDAGEQDRLERALTGHGRLRDAVLGPDGRLWVLTNNTDGRGDPGEGDDRLLALTLPRG